MKLSISREHFHIFLLFVCLGFGKRKYKYEIRDGYKTRGGTRGASRHVTAAVVRRNCEVKGIPNVIYQHQQP